MSGIWIELVNLNFLPYIILVNPTTSKYHLSPHHKERPEGATKSLFWWSNKSVNCFFVALSNTKIYAPKFVHLPPPLPTLALREFKQAENSEQVRRTLKISELFGERQSGVNMKSVEQILAGINMIRLHGAY